jgi:hypothetical protein
MRMRAKELYTAWTYGRKLNEGERILVELYYRRMEPRPLTTSDGVALSLSMDGMRNLSWENYRHVRFETETHRSRRYMEQGAAAHEMISSLKARQPAKNALFDLATLYGDQSIGIPPEDLADLSGREIRQLLEYKTSFPINTHDELIFAPPAERNKNMKYKIKKPDGSMFSWTVDGAAIEVATSDKELRDALTALPAELKKGSTVISFDDTLPDEKRQAPSSSYVTGMIDSLIAVAAGDVREKHQKVTAALRKVNNLTEVSESLVSGSNIFMISTMDATMSDALRRLDDVKTLISSFRAAMVSYEEVLKLKTW